MRYLDRIEPRKHKKAVRTIMNFVRYAALIRELNYKNENRKKLDNLITRIADFGFNKGVETFWTYYHSNLEHDKYMKNEELKSLSKDFGSTLEDIQKAKVREDSSKKAQELKKQKFNRYKVQPYEEGYRPTVDELLKLQPFVQKKADGVDFNIYNVKEKGAWVCLFIFKDRKPLILSGPDFNKVSLKGNEKWFEFTKDKEIYNMYKKEESKPKQKKPRVKKDNLTVDISHVEQAMGIDNNNKDDDDPIEDMINDLFR